MEYSTLNLIGSLSKLLQIAPSRFSAATDELGTSLKKMHPANTVLAMRLWGKTEFYVLWNPEGINNRDFIALVKETIESHQHINHVKLLLTDTTSESMLKTGLSTFLFVGNGNLVKGRWAWAWQQKHEWIQELHLQQIRPSLSALKMAVFMQLAQQAHAPAFYIPSALTSDDIKRGDYLVTVDNKFYLAFWQGVHKIKKIPYISLEISLDGFIKLRFDAGTGINKRRFLSRLASVLSMSGTSNGVDGQELSFALTYTSNYEQSPSVVLDTFLQREFVIINTFIQNELQLHQRDLGSLRPLNTTEMRTRINTVRDILLFEQSFPDATESNYKQAPLALQTLKLQNIGHFSNFQIQLDKRVICLLGDNGCGKTSLLKALIVGLIGRHEKMLWNVENLLRIEGLNTNTGIQYAAEGTIQLSYSVGGIEYTNVLNLYPNEQGGFNIVEENQSLHKSFAFTQGGYFRQLCVGFAQNQSNIHRQKSKYGLPHAHTIDKPNIYDVIPLLNDGQDNRFLDLQQWLYDLYTASNQSIDTPMFGSLAADEKKKYCDRIIKFIFEIISEITGIPLSFVGISQHSTQSNLVWVRMNADSPTLFTTISQGFRNVFAWVGHFIRRLVETNEGNADFAQASALVLVDEIDTYLHPKWQRTILNILVKRFPNTQFIVTTHSPLVASYLKDAVNDCSLYVINPKNDSPQTFQHVYGRDIRAIFYDWMGIEERPQEVTEKIEQLLNLLDDATPQKLEQAQALQIELLRWLPSQDAIMVEIDMSIAMAKYSLH